MTSSNGSIFRVTGPLCGEFTGPGEFPTQRPVTRSFDVFFDLRLNKRLSKQPWGWWFESPLWSLWRHRNVCEILWSVVDFLERNFPVELNQKHACWYPCFLGRQVINSHDIDCVKWESFCSPWERIWRTPVNSVSRDDGKYKHILMFPLLKSACPGSIFMCFFTDLGNGLLLSQ